METTGNYKLSSPQNSHLLGQVLREILFAGKIPRGLIAKRVGCSPAMVTHYTRLLAENGVIQARSVRQPHAKRPIEMMGLSPDYMTCLCLHANVRNITAELINFDSTLIKGYSVPVSSASQGSFLHAVASAVNMAVKEAGRLGKTMSIVGIGVDGELAPEQGIIFRVDGINDWHSCQLNVILDELSGYHVFTWTEVMCKISGFATEIGNDHQLGYVSFSESDIFKIATMQHGEVNLGRIGTESHFLHRQINPEGPECYCGRKGCLMKYIRDGQVSEKELTAALLDILVELDIRHLALEWHRHGAWLKERLEEAGMSVYEIDSQQKLITRGLRYLVAREACFFSQELLNNEKIGIAL